MKKWVFLAVGVAFLLSTISVLAKGGGPNTLDVCFKSGAIEYHNKFLVTKSGVIQEFRYEPNDLHLIFKPKEKFPNPQDEGSWFSWTYYGSWEGDYGQYAACDPESDSTLRNVFGDQDVEYWVEITYQD